MQEPILEMRRLVPAYRTKLPDATQFEAARYRSVEAMICQMARKVSATSGIPFEEIRAEGDLLFVLACRRFNEECGAKFSTFFWSVLHNGLVDFVKHERRRDSFIVRPTSRPDEEEDIDPIARARDETAHRAFLMSDLYNSLSADEAQLVDLVLAGFASSIKHLRLLALERLEFEEAQFEEAVAGIRSLVGDIDG